MSKPFQFTYSGFGIGRAKCELEIIESKDQVVVIATELPDNPGVSITNFAEHLAAIV